MSGTGAVQPPGQSRAVEELHDDAGGGDLAVVHTHWVGLLRCWAQHFAGCRWVSTQMIPDELSQLTGAELGTGCGNRSGMIGSETTK